MRTVTGCRTLPVTSSSGKTCSIIWNGAHDMRTTSRRVQDRLRSAAGAADISHPLLFMKPGRMPVYAVIEFAISLGLDPVMLFRSRSHALDRLEYNLELGYAESA